MSTTSTNTLSDRYLEAVLRRLPARQHADLNRELRASIADAIDDRVAAGVDRAEAERQVLTDLGDPARLAARYADRPFYLIGPELFLDYVRLLTALLMVVVPVVAAVVAVTQTFDGHPLGQIIGDAATAAITTGIHVAFWTTLVFAGLERLPAVRRSAARRPSAHAWTPDALPEVPSRRARYTELVLLTLAVVLFSAAVLLSPVVSPKTDEAGNPIGILAPWLWETRLVYVYIGLVILSLANVFAKYYGPKRTSMAAIGVPVDLAPSIVLIWLVTNDRLFNPAFVEAMSWSPSALRWIELGIVASAGLTILGSIIDAVRRIRTP
jgi:hypothetical protein